MILNTANHPYEAIDTSTRGSTVPSAPPRDSSYGTRRVLGIAVIEQRPAAPAAPAAARINCAHCASRDLCLPEALQPKFLASLPGIFGNSRRVRRGETVHRVGDTFENIYVSRAGSFKTVARRPDGQEQITGFHISGEFIGLEGLTSGVHTLDAIALEDSVVCAIPFRALETLSHEHPELQRHLHRKMSEGIVREASHFMLISMSAEERVAAFLTNLSQRYRERGYSPTEFNLRMSREEIGCYLGLKLETVSRMLSRLRQRGVIEIRGKQTRIVDLEELAHG